MVGGEEVAEQLVQKDLMGPVVTILQQVYLFHFPSHMRLDVFVCHQCS